MKSFEIALLIGLCLCLQAQSFAQDSKPPASPVPELRCDEPISRACNAALTELLAARKLIEAQGRELEAARLRLEAEKQRTKLLAEKNQQLIEHAEALNEALIAERQAKEALRQLSEQQSERIAKLDADKKRLKRLRAIAAIAGIAVGAIIRR